MHVIKKVSYNINESNLNQMKEVKEPVQIGDEFTADFMMNKNGGKPICQIDGMFCFIDNKVKDFVTPSSTWLVAITAIYSTYMVVKPLMKVRTPKENSIIVQEKMDTLRTNSLVSHKSNHPKTVKGYQYKSFSELKKEKGV